MDVSTKIIQHIATTGVDAAVVADDYGANAQGSLRRSHFRALYKPALEKIIDCIKSYNVPWFFHCCGCIHDYLKDLVEIGIDAIHPLQLTAGMDLAAAKAKYGSDFASSGTSIHQGLYPLAHRSKSRRRRLRLCGLPRHDTVMAWHQPTRFMTEPRSRILF